MSPRFYLPIRFFAVLLLGCLFSLSLTAGKQRKPSPPAKASQIKSKNILPSKAKLQEKAARQNHRDKNEKQQLAKKSKRGEEGRDHKKSHLTRAEKRQELAAKRESRREKNNKRELVQNKKAEKNATEREKSLTEKSRHQESDESKSEVASKSKKGLPAELAVRPIVQVAPRADLKFSIDKAVTSTYDSPSTSDGLDVIEVIEFNSPENRKLDELYRQEVKPLQGSSVPSSSRKKIDIKKMDAERISQIQEALAKRGYYASAPTGEYDEMTIEAMRKFQAEHRIDTTGYATAQSLKLLGLMDWERKYE